ncbi:MFS transporter [Oscillatoria sp. FACHB-1407]|uniref:MFS transporter n=1 Tax=Oscillatoria sp. FACHB-1407 TaxID=2692847 RepID=UPI001682D5E6|nr:MFS transporter [Oscillatoria sp. FACHB-1407]MBD2465931.1 MFS transporter [Oscillatoria sp. FACHB-1407]
MKRPAIIVAIAIFLITHAANLQIPLYNTYATLAGFGSGISAIAFSTYVAGLLPTLILLGGASDQIGRKKVILASLLFACVATFLMIAHPTIYTLFVTRVLQGIGVGLITGTGTAYLSTLMPQNSARVAAYVSLTTALGFSSGALLTNLILSIHNSLVPFSYWIIFVLILGCIGLAINIPEQATIPTPLVRLPLFPSKAIWAGLAIALAWSLAGIVGIILPTQLVQYGLPNWSGPMLFIIVMTGVVFQPVARRMEPRRSLQLGSLLMVIGYALFTSGAAWGSLSLVLLGVAIAGIACYGFTYLGGLAEVVRLGGNQSARVTSGYFACAYLGYGIPVILIGFLSDRFGIIPTLVGFGAILLISNVLLIAVYQTLKYEKKLQA